MRARWSVLSYHHIYAEINLKMKAEAMALCDVAEPDPGRHWKKDKDLMAFLNSY